MPNTSLLYYYDLETYAKVQEWKPKLQIILDKMCGLTSFDKQFISTSLTDLLLDKQKNKADYFNPIGDGSFKLVFDLLPNSNLVIKFESDPECARDEREVYKIIEENWLIHFFVDTVFLTLPFPLFADNGDPFNMGEFSSIQIQKKIKVYNDLFESHEESVDSDSIPDYLFALFEDSGLDYRGWIKDAIDTYGLDEVERLVYFLSENQIIDLHDENIGYFTQQNGKEIPVIFDWMSNDLDFEREIISGLVP